MKKYLSVFEMLTRSSIYKVLAILLLMVGVQSGSFYFAMQKYPTYVLEDLVDVSYLSWIWKAAYLLITVAIILPGCNIGSIQNYTFQRLCIKEKRIYLLQSIYNIVCYALLWMTELVILLLLSNYYVNNQAEAVITNQSVFLAFYRSPWMHSILPLEDIPSWLVLLYVLIGTGYAAERFVRKQRQGKIGLELILVMAIILLLFPRGLGTDLAVFLIGIIVIPIQILYRKLLDMGVEDYEK